jgi:uncharacterized repeat protein (TIGR01451 family)
MKKTLSFVVFHLIVYFASAQAPGIKWTNFYHTSGFNNGSEAFFDVKNTPDGGFILAGADTSYNYIEEDYLKKEIVGRPWLIKTDKEGNILWRETSTDVDPHTGSFTAVLVLSDNNILAVGYGGLSGQAQKYLIAKYDNNGARLWYKIYGGITGVSKAYSVKETSDAGFIVAGITTSNDGDVIGNHSPGTSDAWLLKLDGSGNIQWKKCFGGTGADTACTVIQTADNGFVVAGSSTSSDGDLTGNNGMSDGWIFKVNGSGNVLWQKNVGGNNNEGFQDIVLNSDTSYTLIGSTLSASTTDNAIHGKKDLWGIRIKDATGQPLWSKSFGGAEDDQGYSIQRTVGNGFLIGGYTKSLDGDVTGSNGLADAWLLNLSSDGNLVWQKCIGSSKNDFGMVALYLSETDFALAGFAEPTTPAGPFDYTDAFFSRLGNINTIRGLLFNDINLNGIKDPAEVVFNEALVTTTKSGFQRSAIPQNGIFNLVVDIGTYNTSVQVNTPYYNVIPASINSTFATYFNTDSISFAVQPVSGIKDLTISMVPLTPARLGLSDVYRIYYKNTGTDMIGNGEVIFKHDGRLNFISSSPTINSSNGDTLKWNFSNLNPLDTASITVYMQVQTPTAVNLGDTLSSIAIITPVSGDVTPNDDTTRVRQRVIGAYDPNNKYENNEGIIDPSFVVNDRYLNYLIRFQNVGNDTAFNVIVRDTLDSKLDWNTFEMVAASHSYQISITSQNKIEWTFTNINLPDSNINESASHGFIAYRIKPKSTVSIGDTIHNNASIYFDFNLPVETNNAFTVMKSNIILPLTLLSFTGVYKTDQAFLYWTTANEDNVEKFQIERNINNIDFKKVGEKLANGAMGNITSYDYFDNLSNIPGSTFRYRLKMIDYDGGISYSRVLVLKRNNSGNPISVSPNPANDFALIHIYSSFKTIVYINVINGRGQSVLQRSESVIGGNNTIMINNLAHLQSGYYTIIVKKDNDKIAIPFVIFR